MIREYETIKEIKGPLIFVEGVEGVGFGELVKIKDEQDVFGQVLEVSGSLAVVQVFGGTMGLSNNARVRFSGDVMRFGVGSDILGRIFDGLGRPIDGGIAPRPEEKADIRGGIINPVSRKVPSDFIQTGISVIDVTSTLVRGQKLPVFSGSGLPHYGLAAQIVRQSSVADKGFAIVFGAMGLTSSEARFLKNNLKSSGAIDYSVLFMNLANDSIIERLITPRIALTAAEYLAYEQGMHVLVILSDMTNYCDALREISAARDELPGKFGYPGYMYTDLATIYERAGKIKGRKGSITQLPMLTMPNDDITHPIPDLTGYITEGQIVLSRALYARHISPPIQPLSSLSRLMPWGVGEGKTRKDHMDVANQLYALYAKGVDLRNLVSIVGEGALSKSDRSILNFSKEFESRFINQAFYEERSIDQSLELAWSLFGEAPEIEVMGLEKYSRLRSSHGKENDEK